MTGKIRALLERYSSYLKPDYLLGEKRPLITTEEFKKSKERFLWYSAGTIFLSSALLAIPDDCVISVTGVGRVNSLPIIVLAFAAQIYHFIDFRRFSTRERILKSKLREAEENSAETPINDAAVQFRELERGITQYAKRFNKHAFDEKYDEIPEEKRSIKSRIQNIVDVRISKLEHNYSQSIASLQESHNILVDLYEKFHNKDKTLDLEKIEDARQNVAFAMNYIDFDTCKKFVEISESEINEITTLTQKQKIIIDDIGESHGLIGNFEKLRNDIKSFNTDYARKDVSDFVWQDVNLPKLFWFFATGLLTFSVFYQSRLAICGENLISAIY